MFNDTLVTLQAFLGSDVTLRNAGGVPVANFRVACTPRRRTKSGEWVDGTTQWYGVSAWRALAEHCAASLRRGDPVVLHGRLRCQTYVNRAGVESVGYEVEALLVGHDLSRGTTTFTRTARAVDPEGGLSDNAA